MYLSVFTVTVSGLNAPIKRQRVAEWIRKQDPCMCLPPRDPPQDLKDTHRLTQSYV